MYNNPVCLVNRFARITCSLFGLAKLAKEGVEREKGSSACVDQPTGSLRSCWPHGDVLELYSSAAARADTSTTLWVLGLWGGPAKGDN